MEALLEKEGNVESWNDERMDELSRRVDAGFAKTATKEEMNLRFDEVDRRFGEVNSHFAEINDRLDRLSHTLLLGTFGLVAAMIANGIWG
jgi:hypothetical protein